MVQFKNPTSASVLFILFIKLMLIVFFVLIWLKILLGTIIETIAKPDKIYFKNLHLFWFIFQISSSPPRGHLLLASQYFGCHLSYVIVYIIGSKNFTTKFSRKFSIRNREKIHKVTYFLKTQKKVCAFKAILATFIIYVNVMAEKLVQVG